MAVQVGEHLTVTIVVGNKNVSATCLIEELGLLSDHIDGLNYSITLRAVDDTPDADNVIRLLR